MIVTIKPDLVRVEQTDDKVLLNVVSRGVLALQFGDRKIFFDMPFRSDPHFKFSGVALGKEWLFGGNKDLNAKFPADAVSGTIQWCSLPGFIAFLNLPQGTWILQGGLD